MTEENREHKKKTITDADKFLLALTGIILVVLIFNQFQLYSLKTGKQISTGIQTTSASIIPKGTPEIYGNELGIKYDDISTLNPSLADKTINIMGNIDRTTEITGDDLNRYIKVVSEISCEYCCGAKSIIFDNGQPACGCAHSYAMRGLAKYLIINHGSEFTDEEILTELAKWKVLFFPTIMQQKADILAQNGIEASYINVGSNLYRGIEKGSSGEGMVGGC